MKRSEMKEVLLQACLDHQELTDSDIDAILTTLEKAGMSPPFVDEVDDDLKLIGRKREEE